MRKLTYFLIFLLAVFVVACGGGGGSSASGGGNGGNGGGGGTTTYRVEAFNAAGAQVDPTNLIPGDAVNFVIAAYDSRGTRTQVGGSFSSNDTTAGTLTSSGAFTAATSTDKINTITTSVGATKLTAIYRVRPTGAIITGNVISGASTAGIQGIKIYFSTKNASSPGDAGSAYTLNNGSFRAVVPATTAWFYLDGSTIDKNTFYRAYYYNNNTYTALSSVCNASVPKGLTVGGTTAIAGSVVIISSASSPPGPPTGCGK